eukprot:scaffold69309_cov65-Phaeocystis_antarctica.AAC.14
MTMLPRTRRAQARTLRRGLHPRALAHGTHATHARVCERLCTCCLVRQLRLRPLPPGEEIHKYICVWVVRDSASRNTV